jgi:tetratricopeptide (TPR) repeat protein
MRRGVALFIVASLRIFAAQVFLHGRVVTDDGSAPIHRVTIEKACIDSLEAQPIASTNAQGEFSVRIEIFDVDLSFDRSCVLRASLKGYQSTTIEFSDWRLFQDPNLPPITLIKRSTNPTVDIFSDEHVPARATRAWMNAGKAASANRWIEAERQLRAAVLTAPQFAQGWHALAAVLKNQQKVEEARLAERRAIDLNPRLLPAYLMLARFDLETKDWAEAQRSADQLILRDTRHRYIEAYIQRGIARFQLQDSAGAEASMQEAVRLDTKHDFPRAEYLLGMILEARRETVGAREHMNKYLELGPKAFDATEVRTRIEHINDDPGNAATQMSDIASQMEQVAAELKLAASSDAWVPGGLKALAAAAGVSRDLSYSNFFGEFCRALVRENSPGLARGLPQYQARLLAYLASVAELSRMGERKDDSVVVRINLSGAPERAAAAHALGLIGWRLKAANVVEPGDEPVDGLRQWIPALLGIDEIRMQRTLAEGNGFELRLPTQNARLIGGDAWSRLIKVLPAYPGGIAEAFVRDLRLAKVYAGLGAMGADTASAVVSSVGLQTLLERYADVLARYPDAFVLSKDGAAVPGSSEAWTKLAGTSPQTAPAFFHALLDRDFGSLAAFYAALAAADEAHRQFFTATPARAERFYNWYRDSGEPRWSQLVDMDGARNCFEICRWMTRATCDFREDAAPGRTPRDRTMWSC